MFFIESSLEEDFQTKVRIGSQVSLLLYLMMGWKVSSRTRVDEKALEEASYYQRKKKLRPSNANGRCCWHVVEEEAAQ